MSVKEKVEAMRNTDVVERRHELAADGIEELDQDVKALASATALGHTIIGKRLDDLEELVEKLANATAQITGILRSMKNQADASMGAGIDEEKRNAPRDN